MRSDVRESARHMRRVRGTHVISYVRCGGYIPCGKLSIPEGVQAALYVVYQVSS